MTEPQENEQSNGLQEADVTELTISRLESESRPSNAIPASQQPDDIGPSGRLLTSPCLSKDEDKHRSTLRLLLARTYLSQCGILQNIICGVDIVSRGMPERKDECEERRSNRIHYYERMRDLATTANELARKDNSRDLEVRAEYWLARSCGGNHDYKTAIEHLQAAKAPDIMDNPSFDSITIRRPKFLINEEANIDALMQYCTKRLQKRVEREEKLSKRANKEMEKYGISSEVCMVRESAHSPSWAFDHERNVSLVKEWLKNRQSPDLQAPKSLTQALDSTSPALQPLSQASQTIRWDLPLRHAQSSQTNAKTPTMVVTGKPWTFDKTSDQDISHIPSAEGCRYTRSPKHLARRTSSLRHKPTMSRRNTRGSIRSVKTFSSDASSPRRPRLDEELGGDWEDCDESTGVEEENDEIEGRNDDAIDGKHGPDN